MAVEPLDETERRPREPAVPSRVTRTVLIVLSLLVPLAFGPLVASPPDTGQHLNDGKARALARAGGSGAQPHEILDAAKAERAATALAEAEAIDQQVSTPAPCIAGFAGPYPCENVDLAAVVPLAELGGAAGNDSWGWTDPVTGDEIVLVGTGTGVAFVDVTEPTSPRVLGRVETETVDRRALWRDVKVDGNHAFIVSENAGHGMQVFDLTRLRNSVGTARKVFQPDAVYSEFGSAHNIAVNTDSDFAYVVGSDTCEGGLHMVDISDPLAPQFAGCFDEDGYTHDVQCVLYAGPDEDHNGTLVDTGKQKGKDKQKDGKNGKNGKQKDKPQKQTPEPPSRERVGQDEICFAANEDTVTIVDVTDKEHPEMLARIGYETAAYTHQGWLTPDQRWFVFNDELDEDPVLGGGTVDNTTTYMVNVEELDLGVGQDEDGVRGLVKAYSHDTVSIDHNLYITDDVIWQANYNAGLRILRYTEEGLEQGELEPVGYFDADPGVDVKAYGDSWNVYPFFASGTVVVSNLGQGLLVLQPDYTALRSDG